MHYVNLGVLKVDIVNRDHVFLMIKYENNFKHFYSFCVLPATLSHRDLAQRENVGRKRMKNGDSFCFIFEKKMLKGIKYVYVKLFVKKEDIINDFFLELLFCRFFLFFFVSFKRWGLWARYQVIRTDIKYFNISFLLALFQHTYIHIFSHSLNHFFLIIVHHSLIHMLYTD
jgi:hypothetical protein